MLVTSRMPRLANHHRPTMRWRSLLVFAYMAVVGERFYEHNRFQSASPSFFARPESSKHRHRAFWSSIDCDPYSKNKRLHEGAFCVTRRLNRYFLGKCLARIVVVPSTPEAVSAGATAWVTTHLTVPAFIAD